jgi:hypothetical protein
MFGSRSFILVLTDRVTPGRPLSGHGERYQAGTRAPAIYRSGIQVKSAQAMRQYSLLNVLFPFSPPANPELYRLS